MKEFIPQTRPDGYNGPVELPQFAHNDEWCFEEWLHCRPTRSTNDKALFGPFDQADDVKPLTVEYAALEIAYALEVLDKVGLDKVVKAQLEGWDQSVANALCSLVIPMFGYDDKHGGEDGWKQVFDVWFPEFDQDLLQRVKHDITHSKCGVEVWHNTGRISGASWMSWVPSAYWGKSPSFSRTGCWVARPDYKA
jgi:hypothetical protein